VALEEIVKLTQEIRVYSDGSCIGRIGAATVCSGRGEVHTLRKHIGDECHHTVYEAEVIGLTLAAELIARECFVKNTSSVQTIRWQSEP